MAHMKHYDTTGKLVTTGEIRKAVEEGRALIVGEDDNWALFLAIYGTSDEAAVAYEQKRSVYADRPTVQEAFWVSRYYSDAL